jgi:predicted lysophospholipase L1 biosynthesis ABC-type transport system permease subunit
MLSYNFRLALASYRRNPALTALVAGAIALGIAVCTITLTLYHGMSNTMKSIRTGRRRSSPTRTPRRY